MSNTKQYQWYRFSNSWACRHLRNQTKQYSAGYALHKFSSLVFVIVQKLCGEEVTGESNPGPPHAREVFCHRATCPSFVRHAGQPQNCGTLPSAPRSWDYIMCCYAWLRPIPGLERGNVVCKCHQCDKYLLVPPRFWTEVNKLGPMSQEWLVH